MASKRGKRTLVDPTVEGCYRDDIGTCIVVWHGGRPHERRFPPGTTLTKLQQLRACLLADVLGKSTAPLVPSTRRHARDKAGKVIVVTQGGPTLRAAGTAYLATLPPTNLRAARSADVDAWCAVLGAETPVDSITAEAVAAAVIPWEHARIQKRKGFSPGTLKKRRYTLRAVVRHALGRKALDITVDLPLWREPRATARGIPRLAIQYILDAVTIHRVKVGKVYRKATPADVEITRLRLAVIGETGFPHAWVKALHPRHVDYRARTVEVGDRGKGEGSDPRVIPVTRTALDVLRAFFAAGASGPFDSRQLQERFTLAVKAARVRYEAEQRLAWPGADDLRPYDLRHSFGTDYYRSTRDVLATAHVMGHQPGSVMTARYVKAAVDETAARGRDLLDAAAAGPLTLPSARVEPETGTAGPEGTRRRGKVLRIDGGS
jgi:integrase